MPPGSLDKGRRDRDTAPTGTALSRSRLFHARPVLLIAFAFAVMADPVSSVAYAIEAALRALGGDLNLLLPTMALVVGVMALVIVNYHQLVARFPEGGGAAAAAGAAFGEGWAFIPIGSLIVDFVLTISISVAAAASAVIAYFPAAAAWRIPIALVVITLVGGLTWFGHAGRATFAVMTLAFIASSLAVLTQGVASGRAGSAAPAGGSGHPAALAVILAFPVAMALATGVEAPSSAIAQLGQLDDRGRKRFGRITLWLTLGIVGVLTLGLTALAVHLRIGVPAADSTQIADLGNASATPFVYATFQLTTALLLLAAASSSFQAGPGLLKALAQRDRGGPSIGILPRSFGRTNHHHTPYVGVVVYLIVSAAVVVIANAQDQELVLYYAVAVFVSFLCGLVAMTLFSKRDGRPLATIVNGVGAVVVAFTLVVNFARVYPLLSLLAAGLVALLLYAAWVRAGRPRGIAQAVSLAEMVEI